MESNTCILRAEIRAHSDAVTSSVWGASIGVIVQGVAFLSTGGTSALAQGSATNAAVHSGSLLANQLSYGNALNNINRSADDIIAEYQDQIDDAEDRMQDAARDVADARSELKDCLKAAISDLLGL